MTPSFLYDDAYITLASARAVWQGGDAHFPDSGMLDGLTSPFHFVVVTALVAVLPAEWALLISCLLGAVVYGAGLWMLARGEQLPAPESAALVLAGCGIGVVSQHLVNGLETSWALAGVTWLLVCARRGWVRGLGACCGTLPFIRPELAILALAVAGYRIYQQRRIEAGLVAAGVLAAAPWLVLLQWATGGIVPTSLPVKRDWYGETCWSWPRRLSVVGSGCWLWLRANTFVSLGLLGLARRPLGRVALGAMVVTLLTWSLNVPDVLYTYQRFRYYTPFLPLLVAGLALLPVRPGRYVIFAAALASVLTTWAVVRLEPAAIAQIDQARTALVRELAERHAQRVMVHDIGYLPFADAAPLFVDMVGLRSRAAARAHHQFTGPTCGASRGDAIRRLAKETRPDTLVIWQPWDDFFGITRALREGGWALREVGGFGDRERIVVYALKSPPQ